MYPNFENQQDRASKHSALLARIARDQRLEDMKREAYANALRATDSEDTKQKDATENADLIKRIMTAMGSKTSSKTTYSESDSGSKPPASVFSSVADVYEELSKPTEAESNQAMGSEDMDALMNDVSQEAALEEKPANKSDRSEKFRKRIVDIFKRFPELSNREFLPVIIRDGQPIKDERYRISHTDGKIMLNGEQVSSDAEILNDVNWELTYSAIKDKLIALDAAYKKIKNIRSEISSDHPLLALFNEWKSSTNFTKHGADFAKQLSKLDDDQQRALLDYQMGT